MKGFWFAKMVVMIALFIGVVSAVVMVLWNWLMPDIFGLGVISFWQAAGLFLFAKILFGFGKGKHGGDHKTHWAKHWKNKWNNMSEEDREKWRSRFADKWCSHSKTNADDEKSAE